MICKILKIKNVLTLSFIIDTSQNRPLYWYINSIKLSYYYMFRDYVRIKPFTISIDKLSEYVIWIRKYLRSTFLEDKKIKQKYPIVPLKILLYINSDISRNHHYSSDYIMEKYLTYNFDPHCAEILIRDKSIEELEYFTNTVLYTGNYKMFHFLITKINIKKININIQDNLTFFGSAINYIKIFSLIKQLGLNFTDCVIVDHDYNKYLSFPWYILLIRPDPILKKLVDYFEPYINDEMFIEYVNSINTEAIDLLNIKNLIKISTQSWTYFYQKSTTAQIDNYIKKGIINKYHYELYKKFELFTINYLQS